MVLITNGQNLLGATSGLMLPQLNRFKNTMDGMLLEGWLITVDLPPAKTECGAGCRFIASYNKFIGPNGAICQTCKGQGFDYETRQTIYNCNRRWTNTPLDNVKNNGQNTIGGMVFGNFVRTKTVIQSFGHIQESIGATIDGVKVKLYQEPRKTGWAGTDLYVVAWWERANKVIGG